MDKTKILIVEDEAITSDHLRRILIRLGYDVVGVAESGLSALQQMEETNPDLLIADIGLAGEMDGIEVAARARENYGIPSVFLTAYSDGETMRRARDPEPYGFLVKPFAEQALQATIEIALQQDALRTAQAEERNATAQILVRTQEDLSAVTARLFRVQEEEREQIATDLHDDIGQRLALLQVSLQSLWQRLPEKIRKDYNSEFENVIGLVAGVSNDVRGISHRLHPSMLNDLGLAVSLRRLGETFEDSYSVPVRFTVRGLPADLDPKIALALYRIAQEALHNIAKHAGEDAVVSISLIGANNKIDLSIRDTGKGIEPQRLQHFNGIGLISMVKRAETVGGKVSIDSVPGQGTRIRVTAPFTQAPSEESGEVLHLSSSDVGDASLKL